MGCGDLVPKSCPTLATPWIVAHQAPLSLGFPKQEYWNGFPFPSPGVLPDPGIKSVSLALQADSLPLSHQRSSWCVDHNKLWKILKDMEIPDQFTFLLRNLYAGQEETVRIGYGTADSNKIEKGLCQDCILSSCLFYLYAEYIMRNARLDETQAGIKMEGKPQMCR